MSPGRNDCNQQLRSAARLRTLAPMRSKRQRRGEVVVQRVLEVTLDELGRVGLERLSVPEVAARAGLNKTSVYRRWPTKEALVKAALERSMTHLDAAPDTGTLPGDLVSLALLVAGFLGSPHGLGVMRTVFADGDSPQARALAKAMWKEQGARAPRDLLSGAIRRGELDRRTDPDLLLFTIAGAVLHRTFVERKPANEAWARRLVAMLTRGVGRQR